MRKLRAALLGATGAVGQRYVSMLSAHQSIKLTLLSHNTIRGAAGTAILTAELMASEGYIGR